jgi:SAM-dependent methyltransferase
MNIERRAFAVGPDDWGHIDFTRRLHSRLEELGGGMVCELGGGARPAVELDFLAQNGLECLVVDVSETELQKAPSGYATLVGDVSSPGFRTPGHDGRYDLVFSRVVAEHVPDARQFHLNTRRLLRPGGLAMHFFPTLWWPPYVVNRVLPETLAERILLRLEPWRESSGKSGKFPAYYHWCYGPTARQIKRFASVGFSVEHCVAYFGEPSHAPGKALEALNDTWTSAMLRRPSYLFTSYAAYTLRAV